MDNDVYVKNCYHVGTICGNKAKMPSIAGTVDDFDKIKGNAYITNCFVGKGRTLLFAIETRLNVKLVKQLHICIC